ncbi:4Fe-4S single cluster domain protein [Enterobacter cloacae S611]|uniref:4Fe-4S single cluster domain protein n=1 Tax=Enterobacter cloacae S611 TaxID=1399146 RepID=A0ABN0Q744_ENTCL|nr:4Fe-4S single cluster domain protein [Enterobacter cloacae S611]
MKYHQYYPVDIVNAPGTRCTLFVSGCVHECLGCYNKSTSRLNSGLPFTQEMVELINVLIDGKFMQDLKDPMLIWRGSSNQVVHHLR